MSSCVAAGRDVRPAAGEAVDCIDRCVHASHDENAVAEHRHQRLQVPIAVLELVAGAVGDQLHDDQRDDRRHHIDEAVHAIENDRLRARGNAAGDAHQAQQDRQGDRELERGLFDVGLLGRHGSGA